MGIGPSPPSPIPKNNLTSIKIYYIIKLFYKKYETINFFYKKKYEKKCLRTIFLLLIIIKAKDTCNALTTEDTCNEGTNYEWTVVGKCIGDCGTTCSLVTSSSNCGEIS